MPADIHVYFDEDDSDEEPSRIRIPGPNARPDRRQKGRSALRALDDDLQHEQPASGLSYGNKGFAAYVNGVDQAAAEQRSLANWSTAVSQ